MKGKKEIGEMKKYFNNFLIVKMNKIFSGNEYDLLEGLGVGKR